MLHLSRFPALGALLIGALMLPVGYVIAQGAGELTEQVGERNELDAEGDEDAAPLFEEVELPPVKYDRFNTATLRALDKITGRSTDIDVRVDEPIVFGSLRVTLKSCHQTPPELPPESAAFLEVDSVQATQASTASETAAVEGDRLFTGWMFASSPGLSALEHPVYDIWTIRCTTSAPSTGASDG